MASKEFKMDDKPSYYILGSSSCPACKNAIKKGLAYSRKTGKLFRYIDLEKNRNFDELLKKYKAIPIYLLPDGTVHIGVMQLDDLDSILENAKK